MSSEIPIDFYFDFLSPYSYLAFVQLKRITKRNPNVVINYKPTLFPALLNHWGQLGKKIFTNEKLLEKANSQYAKDLLKAETNESIARGVFGVPTFIIKGQLFWGKDQLEYIEQLLKGNDLTEGSDKAVKQWAKTPRGADRKEYIAAKAKL